MRVSAREALQLRALKVPGVNPQPMAVWYGLGGETCRMAKKEVKLDPDDRLGVSEVGPWASEKHARLQAYIEISGAARRKYIPPPSWHAGAAYIELFSGPGR